MPKNRSYRFFTRRGDAVAAIGTGPCSGRARRGLHMNRGMVETRIPTLNGAVVDDARCLADGIRMRMHS